MNLSIYLRTAATALPKHLTSSSSIVQPRRHIHRRKLPTTTSELLKYSPNYLCKVLLLEARQHVSENAATIPSVDWVSVLGTLQLQIERLTYRDILRILKTAYILQNVNFNFMVELADKMSRLVQTLPLHTVAQITYSFSRLEIYHPPLFEAVTTCFTALNFQVPPQPLTLISLSFGHLELCNATLFNCIANLAKYQLAHYTPSELVHFLYGFALVGIYNFELIYRAKPIILSMMEGLSPEELVMLAYILGKFEVNDSESLCKIEGLLFTAPPQRLINEKTSELPTMWKHRVTNFTWQTLDDLELGNPFSSSSCESEMNIPKTKNSLTCLDQLNNLQLVGLSVSMSEIGFHSIPLLAYFRQHINLSLLSWDILCYFGTSIARLETFSIFRGEFLPAFNFWFHFRKQFVYQLQLLLHNKEIVSEETIFKLFENKMINLNRLICSTFSNSVNLSCNSSYSSISIFHIVEIMGHLMSHHNSDDMIDWDKFIIEPFMCCILPFLHIIIKDLKFKQIAPLLKLLRSCSPHYITTRIKRNISLQSASYNSNSMTQPSHQIVEPLFSQAPYSFSYLKESIHSLTESVIDQRLFVTNFAMKLSFHSFIYTLFDKINDIILQYELDLMNVQHQHYTNTELTCSTTELCSILYSFILLQLSPAWNEEFSNLRIDTLFSRSMKIFSLLYTQWGKQSIKKTHPNIDLSQLEIISRFSGITLQTDYASNILTESFIYKSSPMLCNTLHLMLTSLHYDFSPNVNINNISIVPACLIDRQIAIIFQTRRESWKRYPVGLKLLEIEYLRRSGWTVVVLKSDWWSHTSLPIKQTFFEFLYHSNTALHDIDEKFSNNKLYKGIQCYSQIQPAAYKKKEHLSQPVIYIHQNN